MTVGSFMLKPGLTVPEIVGITAALFAGYVLISSIPYLFRYVKISTM
jgi:hypothetical protein